MKITFHRPSPYAAKLRVKRKYKSHLGWLPFLFLFIGVLSLYCVLFPAVAGVWGRGWAQILGWFSGIGRFFLPLLIVYLSLVSIFSRQDRLNIARTFSEVGLYWLFLVFMTLIGEAVWQANMGGVVGLATKTVITRMFGLAGAWICTLGGMLTLLVVIMGISPKVLIRKMVLTIEEDFKKWKEVKDSPKKENRRTVVTPSSLLTGTVPNPPPPKIMGLETDVDKRAKKIESSSTPKAPEKKLGHEPLSQSSKPLIPVPSEESSPPIAPKIQAIPYHSPAIDIFEAAGGGIPVPKEELTGRAALLEKTLANFNIAARVVEIHPGPVITRYDLEPAPGVKVASIVSRSDDLALAMRSTGMRVLAPIPGKGAVGIEIPNSHMEIVRLRSLLSHPNFIQHKSPLAFVLGKTVSGEPYFVDLASMPHMLIAGATGSGKSVVVHALISSILYRQPPDRVKFVLIDPKRLELPSYTLIPHLYDPCHGPMQAEVITSAKQAGKALGRLVKVMEYRYDLFAKANVRNIDSYNLKRASQGLPPEYFIVVVIDEFADLMLTGPKVVEDSFQRLAQMARAVGIHLVLATQRPSVDVITGVIKANLPARIALRVATGIDSRVILDVVGAESLLGKGDMLFLPPAAMDPIRLMGAFVSEKDVEHLVDHVKVFGPPFYDDLFKSGSALEFSVEDKKEMLDLIEALKLVLERKRVSQDLLKSQFGSSARATNILSLMEIKQFINKPEGSNRWDINFDNIEEFLENVGRIPEKELSS